MAKRFSRRRFLKHAFANIAGGTAIGAVAGLSKHLGKPTSKARPAQQKKAVERKKTVKRAVTAKRPSPNKPLFPTASGKMSVLLPENAPCLSALQIEAELRRRNSPAFGFGKAFEKWGKHYGVRPAVALAFFRMESNWGTKGIAAKTKSIGNIRFTPWSGSGIKYENYKGFRKYASWEDGIKDFFWLISSKNYAAGGMKTLKQVISKYEPSNAEKYQQVVVNYLNKLFEEASILYAAKLLLITK